MLKNGDLSELYVLLARGVRPPPREASHAPFGRRAGATGCPREPRQWPPGSPGRPPGLAGCPQPQGWVSGGPGLRPDPEPRAPLSRGGSRLPVRCNGFVN